MRCKATLLSARNRTTVDTPVYMHTNSAILSVTCDSMILPLHGSMAMSRSLPSVAETHSTSHLCCNGRTCHCMHNKWASSPINHCHQVSTVLFYTYFPLFYFYSSLTVLVPQRESFVRHPLILSVLLHKTGELTIMDETNKPY